MRPRIAIPHPTTGDFAYNRINVPAFEQVVTEAGGTPVLVDPRLSSREQQQLAETCDAILLPGSPADVDPTSYGQSGDPATAPADPLREALDRLLLDDAYRHRKPILAVCFGTQMLNVYHGGTLVQDLTVMPVNHSASRSVLRAHTAEIKPGSLLGSLIPVAEYESGRLAINSSHHQAVGIPGAGLTVSARSAEDLVVEAVEDTRDPDHFVLGVQWHPERTVAISATSRALFAHLVTLATQP